MRRRTFDALLAVAGLVVAIVLLVAGGLLSWAHSYVGNQVHSQLSQQQIFFPPKGSAALAPKEIGPYLNKYAGQQLLAGDQANAYANHFIAVHLKEIGGGKTYSQLSAASLADPKNTKLAGQVDTMFRGNTLRGLLLNAYAFATMGTIAGIAATVSYIGAGMLFLLSLLGFVHLRRTAAERDLLPKLTTPSPEPATV